MFDTVYVIYTESGAVYSLDTSKERALENVRLYTIRDSESYIVQEYTPTRTIVTTIPVPHKNDSLPSPYLYETENKNNPPLIR